MTFDGSFGHWLKQRRAALDLTQAELADQVGCAAITIRKIEADQRRPSKQVSQRLADVLAISLEERDSFLAFARRLPDPEPLDNVVAAPAHNLPSQATPFIGRERELADIAERLADPGCRLLTLVGPGGIGKTRLALQAAADQLPTFADGVYFVSLSPVAEATFVPAAIASALQFSFYGRETPEDQVVNFLRRKQMLLLLDNYEHLVAGIDLLAVLLANAPTVKLLVTSRERLNMREEWILPLAGLPYPASDGEDDLTRYSALALFIQTAQRIQPDFALEDNLAAVIDICRTVEGMPLGIELAASWLRAMPCEQIASQIHHDLDFLSTSLRNVPERHRSLRAVFEHSWGLLSEAERAVVMKLSVFRGGCDLEAAQQIAGVSLEMLAGLVDKSLVRLDPAGRYQMHELLRQFAADKLLESGAEGETRQRHLQFFLALAEQAETHFYDHSSEAWFHRLEVEHDNLRIALARLIDEKQVELGLRLAETLWFFWEQRGHTHEASRWFEELLGIARGASAAIQATALRLAGGFAEYLGDHERARLLCEESLWLARSTGDEAIIAWSLAELGFTVEAPDDLSRAATLQEEALLLFRRLEDVAGISHTLRGLGWVLTAQGEYKRARTLLDEALTLARETGDRTALAWALFLLGNVIWFETGDSVRPQALYDESLELCHQLKNRIIPGPILFMIGQIARSEGDDDHALTCYRESLRLMHEGLAGSLYVAHVLAGVGGLIGVRGRPEQATMMFGATDRYLHRYQGNHFPFGKPANFDQDVATVRARLDKAAFASAFATGQKMSLDEAATLALEDGLHRSLK